MRIDDIKAYAEELIKAPSLADKKDNLDSYRHIVLFLAKDMLGDVRMIEDLSIQLNHTSRLRFMLRRSLQKQINGIKYQIEIWTLKQIQHYLEKLNLYISEGWVDKI